MTGHRSFASIAAALALAATVGCKQTPEPGSATPSAAEPASSVQVPKEAEPKPEEPLVPVYDEAFFEAIEGENYELMNRMLDERPGLVLGYEPGGRTPLIASMLNGNPDVVKLLLKRGAEVDAGSRGDSMPGATALHAAAMTGRTNVVQILLDNGADVDATVAGGGMAGMTPIMLATIGEHLHVVKLLLRHKPSLNMSASGEDLYKGKAAIHFAAQAGSLDIVRALAKAPRIDLDAAVLGSGETPLHFAIAEGHEAVAVALLDAGADANAETYRKVTLIQLATQAGEAGMVKALLEHGANPDVHWGDGWDTPLLTASRSGRLDIVKALLEHGAPHTPVVVDVVTPMHAGAFNGNAKLLELLLSYGADPNRRASFDGMTRVTPLLGAVVGGHYRAVEVLLKHGADPNISTGAGKFGHLYPLELAVEYRHGNIVRLLRKHGAKRL